MLQDARNLRQRHVTVYFPELQVDKILHFAFAWVLAFYDAVDDGFLGDDSFYISRRKIGEI